MLDLVEQHKRHRIRVVIYLAASLALLVASEMLRIWWHGAYQSANIFLIGLEGGTLSLTLFHWGWMCGAESAAQAYKRRRPVGPHA